jgi:hypothetical protein
MVIFKSAEEAANHVNTTSITGDRFELAISNDVTFAGQPDTMGAGMAILVDGILAQGYIPDGFEQRDGYRLYSYVLM